MDEQGPDLDHGADRDSYLVVAPRAPVPDEHVGHMVAAGLHDQPLDLPYLAVGRADGQLAAYVYLAERDRVHDDLLRGFRSARAADVGRTAHPEDSGGQRKKAHARG